MRHAIFAVALAMAAASAAPAQTAMSVRSVLVSVSGAGGLPIVGLLPDDFQIEVDGLPVDTVTARPARYPLVIMVDTGAAARELVTGFRAPLTYFAERTAMSPMALLTFGDTPVVAVKFTPEVSQMVRRLNGLFARPETASYLLDGLHRVAQEVKRLEVPVADAVVVTAPSFDASRRDSARLLRDLIASGVRVHVVAQRTRVSATMPTPRPRSQRSVSAADMMVYTSREQMAVLDEIAAATGGSLQQVDLQSGLTGALQQIHDRHLGEYVVEFVSPPGAGDEGVRLRVNLAGARVTMTSLSR